MLLSQVKNKDIEFFIDRDLSFIENNLQFSQEGIAQIAQRLFHKYVDAWYYTTIDTFNGIFTLMNVGGILDKVTYSSPLEDKVKLNKFTFYKAVNSNNPLFNTINIHRPRSMVATYLEVQENNRKIFETISIFDLIKTASNAIEQIKELLSDNTTDEGTYTKTLSHVVTRAVTNVNKIKTLSTEHDKQFKGNPGKEVTFTLESEFKDVHGFREFIDTMIKDFKHIVKLGDVRKGIEGQASEMRTLVDLLEHRSDLTNRSNLKTMLMFCDYITNCYQLFGAVALTHMGMETNLGVTMDEIIKLYFSK